MPQTSHLNLPTSLHALLLLNFHNIVSTFAVVRKGNFTQWHHLVLKHPFSIFTLTLTALLSLTFDEKSNLKIREHVSSSNETYLSFFQFAFVLFYLNCPQCNLSERILILISTCFLFKRNIHILGEDLFRD